MFRRSTRQQFLDTRPRHATPHRDREWLVIPKVLCPATLAAKGVSLLSTNGASPFDAGSRRNTIVERDRRVMLMVGHSYFAESHHIWANRDGCPCTLVRSGDARRRPACRHLRQIFTDRRIVIPPCARIPLGRVSSPRSGPLCFCYPRSWQHRIVFRRFAR